jgi:hypothetical protein
VSVSWRDSFLVSERFLSHLKTREPGPKSATLPFEPDTLREVSFDEIRRRVSDDSDRATIAAMALLAIVHAELDRRDEAESLLLEALEIASS